MGASASVPEDATKASLLLTALCDEKQIPLNNWEDLLQFARPHEEMTDEKELHLRGISGELLYAILKMLLVVPQYDASITTGNFCQQFVKPATLPYKSSFVRLASSLFYNNTQGLVPLIGTPNRFISHTWGYEIRKTIQAVLEHPEGGRDKFYWFDIFCLNQHGDEIGHKDFNSFLQKAMQQTGHTLFVCYPWYKPISVTRAWCLYEVMESLKPQNKIKFIPVLDPEDQDAFTTALLEDTSALIEIFINVDATKATAYLKEDLKMIFQWVQRSVGFEAMNTALLKGLSSWIKQAGELEISKRQDKITKQLSATTDEQEIKMLKQQLNQLTKRKEALLGDLGRFEKVPPLLQVRTLASVPDTKMLNSPDIPVLLGTTKVHTDIHGGVFPAFMQLLVSMSNFRQDVRQAMTSNDESSQTASTPFHGELRSICDLWEKARDGIISIDLMIDKLPTRSREMALSPSDMAEFFSVLIDDNPVLSGFWPKIKYEYYDWYDSEKFGHRERSRKEESLFIRVSENPFDGQREASFLHLLASQFTSEQIDGCIWRDNYNDDDHSRDEAATVTRELRFGEHSPCGRLAVNFNRFTLDFTTFDIQFAPLRVPLPSQFSLETLPMSKSISKDTPQPIYKIKSIIVFTRLDIQDEDDVYMGRGVFDTYTEVNGKWWFCSEYLRKVEMMSWEMVQEKTARSWYLVLFDSN